MHGTFFYRATHVVSELVFLFPMWLWGYPICYCVHKDQISPYKKKNLVRNGILLICSTRRCGLMQIYENCKLAERKASIIYFFIILPWIFDTINCCYGNYVTSEISSERIAIVHLTSWKLPKPHYRLNGLRGCQILFYPFFSVRFPKNMNFFLDMPGMILKSVFF